MGADKSNKEFDNFQELFRKIIAVPKSEVLKLEKAEKAKRRPAKRRRATRSTSKKSVKKNINN